MLAYLSHRHPVFAGVAHAGLRQIYDTDPTLFKQWVKSFDYMLKWDADPLAGPTAARVWWRQLSEIRQAAHWFEGYDLIRAFVPTHARDAIRMSPCGPMSADLYTALIKTRIVSIVAQQVYRFLVLPYPIVPAFRYSGCHSCHQRCTCFPDNNLALRTIMQCFVPILQTWEWQHPQRSFTLTGGQMALLGLVPAGGGSFRPYVHG